MNYLAWIRKDFSLNLMALLNLKYALFAYAFEQQNK